MYPKPKTRYDFLIISILALVVTIVVGSYEIYQDLKTSPESTPIPAWYTKPLSPILDTTVLDKLQSRLSVSSQPPSMPTPTATPTPKRGKTPPPIASPSALPSTNSATTTP